jgi:RNA polymerase sigma-70 factor (ECF subfamily)
MLRTTVQTRPFESVLRAWQAHERELLMFLTHRLGDKNTAEDILQDVFLKAMRQGAHFCDIDAPRAWLFQVARTTLIDHARLTRPTFELPDDLAAPDEDMRAPVDELDACLARNLSELLPEDREILDACNLQAHTVGEFAQQHSLSLAAAKSRLLRARKRLRDALVRNCQVQFDDSGNVCCHIPRDPI